MTHLLLTLLLGADPAWFGVSFDPADPDCARIKYVARDGGVIPDAFVGDCLDQVGRVATPNAAAAVGELQKQTAGRVVALTLRKGGVVTVTPGRPSRERTAAFCEQMDWAEPEALVEGTMFKGFVRVRLTHRGFTVREALGVVASDGGVPAIDLAAVHLELHDPGPCFEPGQRPPKRVATLESVLVPRSRLGIVAKGTKFQIVR